MSRTLAWRVRTSKCGTAPQERDGDRDNLPPHRDEPQVSLDVKRSFVTICDPGCERDTLRSQLESLIRGTLRRYPTLNYFQGYHDLVAVILLTMCPDASDWEAQQDQTQQLVDNVSLFFVRDSMCADMLPALGQLRIVRNIVRAEDKRYADALDAALRPHTLLAALPWVLTLFTHNLSSLSSAQTLLDYVFERGPASTLYVAAALILWHREKGVVGTDGAELHASLSSLPFKAQGELSGILNAATRLQQRHPLYCRDVHAHMIMAPASVLFTWDSDTCRDAAAAERILTLPTSSVVLDAMPTPDEPVRVPHRRKRRLVFGLTRIPLALFLFSAGFASLVLAYYLGARMRPTPRIGLF